MTRVLNKNYEAYDPRIEQGLCCVNLSFEVGMTRVLNKNYEAYDPRIEQGLCCV
jgi:hypothetical protein